MSDVAVSVRITGEVQGVGFRWSCAQQAGRLGVCGWVRNEPDDSVAGVFEGASDAVDALVDWCRSGPRGARVAGVDVAPAEVSGAAGFETRF